MIAHTIIQFNVFCFFVRYCPRNRWADQHDLSDNSDACKFTDEGELSAERQYCSARESLLQPRRSWGEGAVPGRHIRQRHSSLCQAWLPQPASNCHCIRNFNIAYSWFSSVCIVIDVMNNKLFVWGNCADMTIYIARE